MSYSVVVINKFNRDLKRITLQNKNVDLLFQVIEMIKQEITLNEIYRDHKLTGSYKGCRECNIEPDFLLIYKILKEENVLLLLRCGSHSELFK